MEVKSRVVENILHQRRCHHQPDDALVPDKSQQMPRVKNNVVRDHHGRLTPADWPHQFPCKKDVQTFPFNTLLLLISFRGCTLCRAVRIQLEAWQYTKSSADVRAKNGLGLAR